MAYDSLTPLPAPPNPDNPATFDTLAYPFTVAQRDMVPELNAFIDALNEQGWPTVQARAQIAGTAAAPVWTWEADPDTGIFLQGAGQWAVSTGGVRRLLISTTSISAYLPILSQPGTAAAPGLAFFGGSNAGLFLQSAGALGLSVGGTEQVRITEGGQVLASGTGSPAIPSFSWIGDPNTGIYRPGNEQIAISTNGIQRLLVSTTALTSSVPVFAPAGTAAAPGYSVAGDTNTGMLFPAADTIAWSTGGTEKLRLTSAGLLTSTTAITQNNTDTGLGRLVKTGWLGLGTLAETPPADFGVVDNSITPCLYAVNNASPLGMPAGMTTGFIQHMRRATGGGEAQIAYCENLQSVFVRVRGTGAWLPWRRNLASADILGTVSQSGGVPTGAIIERGANANGEYVKFADGTMICQMPRWLPVLTGVTTTTSVNNGTMSLPATFSGEPTIFISADANTGGEGWSNSSDRGRGNVSARATPSTYVTNLLADSLGFLGAQGAFNIMAIGRWF